MEESNPSRSWKCQDVQIRKTNILLAFQIIFPLYLAAAGCVEPAELLRLGWVIVAGVLLDVLKLKELDVCVQKYVAKGVGPYNLRGHYYN